MHGITVGSTAQWSVMNQEQSNEPSARYDERVCVLLATPADPAFPSRFVQFR